MEKSGVRDCKICQTSFLRVKLTGGAKVGEIYRCHKSRLYRRQMGRLIEIGRFDEIGICYLFIVYWQAAVLSKAKQFNVCPAGIRQAY